MSDFDPAAFAAGKGDDFDPAAFAAQPATAAPPARAVSTAEGAERGALQGATFGFGDELAAHVDSLVSKIPVVRDVAQKLNTMSGGSGAGLPVDDPNLTYEQRRDAYRGANAGAAEQHPTAYAAGELGGGLATAAAAPVAGPGFGGAVGTNALFGGLAGAGASEAGTPGGVLADAGAGALAGGVTGGALHGAGALPAGALERSAARAATTRTPVRDAVAKAAGDVKSNVLQIGRDALLGAVAGHGGKVAALSAAARVGAPVARAAGVAADEALAKFLTAARRGNKFAQKVVEDVAATPGGAHRLALAAVPEVAPHIEAAAALHIPEAPPSSAWPPEGSHPAVPEVAPAPVKWIGPGRAPNLDPPKWAPSDEDAKFAKKLGMNVENYRNFMTLRARGGKK